jgi:hypothetical protein
MEVTIKFSVTPWSLGRLLWLIISSSHSLYWSDHNPSTRHPSSHQNHFFDSSLTLLHEDGGSTCRRKARYALSEANSAHFHQIAIFPHILFVSPSERSCIIFVTLCTHIKKQSITIDSVELCMWSRGWRGGRGGVKTRELPCLNAKHVNIDSVTCFVDIKRSRMPRELFDKTPFLPTKTHKKKLNLLWMPQDRAASAHKTLYLTCHSVFPNRV